MIDFTEKTPLKLAVLGVFGTGKTSLIATIPMSENLVFIDFERGYKPIAENLKKRQDNKLIEYFNPQTPVEAINTFKAVFEKDYTTPTWIILDSISRLDNMIVTEYDDPKNSFAVFQKISKFYANLLLSIANCSTANIVVLGHIKLDTLTGEYVPMMSGSSKDTLGAYFDSVACMFPSEVAFEKINKPAIKRNNLLFRTLDQKYNKVCKTRDPLFDNLEFPSLDYLANKTEWIARKGEKNVSKS